MAWLPMSPQKIGDMRQTLSSRDTLRASGARSPPAAGRVSGWRGGTPTSRSSQGLSAAEWVEASGATGGAAWARPTATGLRGNDTITPREVRELMARHSSPRRDALPPLPLRSNASMTASGIQNSPERVSFATPRAPAAYNIFNDRFRMPLAPGERLGQMQQITPRTPSTPGGAGRSGWKRSDMIGGHRKSKALLAGCRLQIRARSGV
jgi:hypothetical protein